MTQSKSPALDLFDTESGAPALEPPSSNHGGYQVSATPSFIGNTEASAPVGAAAFDWYAATIYAEEDGILSHLAGVLECDVKEGSPLNGYERGYALTNAGGVVARVLAGGNRGAKPHVFGGGAAGQDVAREVRREWRDEHHVTRLDSRLDFGAAGAEGDTWDRLYEACVTLAADRGLRTAVAGDYLGKENGRTLYVGSRKSDVYVRLYEKGKQLRGTMHGDAERAAVSPDWVRLEVQVRPKGDARFTAAFLDAEAAWGFSKWTKQLVSDVAGLDVEREMMQHKRASDDERAFQWLAQQYGGLLLRRAEASSWQAVADDLAAAVVRANPA